MRKGSVRHCQRKAYPALDLDLLRPVGLRELTPSLGG